MNNTKQHIKYCLRVLKKNPKRFKYIFTIGCFDKLHIGHEKMLYGMKQRCDTLIVGLHSSESISKIKNLKVDSIQDYETRKNNVLLYADVCFEIKDADPTADFKAYIETNFKFHKNITIGPSKHNSKSVELNEDINTPIKFYHKYKDRFSYTIDDKKLRIKRIDENKGWGQNLIGYCNDACYIRANDNMNFPGKEYIQTIMLIEYINYSNNISSTTLRDTGKVATYNKLLQLVSSTLAKYNIPYYLDCGTLLGCVRDGIIMEKDTDIDISTHLSQWSELLKINWGANGLKLKRTNTGYPHKKGGNMISVSFPGSTKLYCDIYTMPAFPKISYTPLNGKLYPIPVNPELYLKQLYGSRWNIPAKKHANVTFHRNGGLVKSPYKVNWDPKYTIFKTSM